MDNLRYDIKYINNGGRDESWFVSDNGLKVSGWMTHADASKLCGQLNRRVGTDLPKTLDTVLQSAAEHLDTDHFLDLLITLAQLGDRETAAKILKIRLDRSTTSE